LGTKVDAKLSLVKERSQAQLGTRQIASITLYFGKEYHLSLIERGISVWIIPQELMEIGITHMR
jgi:hypothetical protein